MHFACGQVLQWPSQSWLENICNLGYSDQKHLFLHWAFIAANPYFFKSFFKEEKKKKKTPNSQGIVSILSSLYFFVKLTLPAPLVFAPVGRRGAEECLPMNQKMDLRDSSRVA